MRAVFLSYPVKNFIFLIIFKKNYSLVYFFTFRGNLKMSSHLCNAFFLLQKFIFKKSYNLFWHRTSVTHGHIKDDIIVVNCVFLFYFFLFFLENRELKKSVKAKQQEQKTKWFSFLLQTSGVYTKNAVNLSSQDSVNQF